MVDVKYKGNVLVKADDTAVNLEQETYRRIEGLVNYEPFRKIGCNWTYKALIRYVVVGTGDMVTQLNDIIEITGSKLISSDTNRERVLRDEKLDGLLPTNLDRIFKIVYEHETILSKNECERICTYC